MSSDNRRPYEKATALTQAFLDDCRDNLETRIELTVDIETPTGFIRASDRPKYVDDVYYDNRLVFPQINRTVGEWLSTELEFSVLKLELNNADGKFDEFLPGGTSYDGFIGKKVTVKIGLRDIGSTYRTIYSGRISDVGGFSRTVRSIVISSRDDYEKLDVVFPVNVLTATSFPDIGESVAGTVLPVIYGDWTVSGNPVTENASVPGYVVNEQDPAVNGDPDDTTPRTEDVHIYISANVNRSLDTSGVWLKRGESFVNIDPADINSIVDNRHFKLEQEGVTQIFDDEGNAVPYKYERGDEFFVKVLGQEVAGFNDNIVAQAEHILLNYTDATAGDFDAPSWTYFKSKAASPNNIATIKSRIWRQEPESAIKFALSLLEQVRIEAFIDDSLKIKLTSLHFDEWDDSPTHTVDNFDVVEGTFQPQLDIRNNFNRAQGVFSFLPDINENSQRTSIFKNIPAATQMTREISKEIAFPNLYESADVVNQLKEILKIASSGYEHVVCDLTWRAMLLDIGDFVFLNVNIGSTVFENVPCLIREIGYDPEGIKIPVKLWSTQLLPFGSYPGVPNAVGGESVTITEET